MPGRLIISLDFELHWGVFDHTPLDEGGRAYFDRTRKLVVPLLEAFEAAGVHASWATVGMLFARDRAELEAALPTLRPTYRRAELDPYRLLEQVGQDEAEDPYHYAASLIDRIAGTAGQYLGSHTFSHYYCLEAGQTAETFAADLAAAQALAYATRGTRLTSLVFPRNQYSPDYLRVIAAQGFTSYRTNPDVWFWQARAGADTGAVQKLARLADHYLPLHSTSAFPAGRPTDGLLDIPASRFLRPYLPKLDGYGGQRLKVRRICREMRQAARQGLDYHLWWHPHNLATDPTRNMAAVRTILTHYRQLRTTYGMQSVSMEECTTPTYVN